MGPSSSPTHRIRLRGPWRYTAWEGQRKRVVAAGQPLTGPLPCSGTCIVPTTWQAVFGDRFYGRARFERSFGCPTGLRPVDRIILQIHGFERPLGIHLNGDRLQTQKERDDVLACDVSGQLRQRNLLSVEIEFAGDSAGPYSIGDAELVIRSAG